MRRLHDGKMPHVTDNGPLLQAFAVTNVLKQVFLFAHALSSLMLYTMLMNIDRDRPTDLGRTVQTGPAMYEANRLTVVRAECKSQLTPTCNASTQPPNGLPTMSADIPDTNRCYWTDSNQLQHPDETS
nr:unnamed protein product [Spirometra erinaceieuropaei]